MGRLGGVIALGALGALGLGASGCGRIAIDPVDRPARWEELGASASALGISGLAPGAGLGGVRLALRSDERPIVSWMDDASGNTEVHLTAWTGDGWAGFAGSDAGGGVSNDPERSLLGGLAVGPADRVCQAWVADELNRLRMRCWDGSTWSGLAGSDAAITTPGNPWWPTLTFVGDQPLLAWEDYGGGSTGTYARRFDGTTWQWLGPAALPGIAPGQHVAITGTSSDDLWLAWMDIGASEIQVVRWNGTGWAAITPAVGGLSNTSAPSDFPRIRIGDRPYVAWLDGDPGATSIYVRAWDGTAWVELAGSASGEGIAPGLGPAGQPDLAIGPDGLPVVAFAAAGDAHVLAWNGTAWVRVGDQAHDGVSRSGIASYPGLEIAPSGAMVLAWNEELPDGAQIYLRWLAADAP